MKISIILGTRPEIIKMSPVIRECEIAKTNLITDLLDKDWVKVKKANDEDLKARESDEEFKNLGSGEKECLVLCKQFRESVLLISDNKARKIAN